VLSLPEERTAGAGVSESRFHPIIIRYDGLDADRHEIELGQLGMSLNGAAQLIGIAANIVVTGHYVKKMPALAVRVYAKETAGRCFEIAAIIATVYPVVQPALPFFRELGSKAVEAIVNYVVAKFAGRPNEMETALQVVETAMRENGETSRAAIDGMRDVVRTMAEAQRPAARKFVLPIGETCATARLGSPNNGAVLIDRPMKDAINSEGTPEITDERAYRVFISEMDNQTHSCKLSVENDDDPDRRYPGDITDPVVAVPENVYARAMAAHRWLSVRAKTRLVEGDLERFYISNIVDD
jgi:hypothetical protein